MSGGDLPRGFFCLLYAGALAWAVYRRDDPEFQYEDEKGNARRRLNPIVSPMLLDVYIVIVFVQSWFVLGREVAIRGTLGLCFNVFLHIAVYYVLLVLALPLLRKRFSARACALFWLLPNYLYITSYSFMRTDGPKLVLRAEGRWLYPALCVWFAGACGVMLWNIFAHLRFRRRLLRDAEPVTDPEVLDWWRYEQARARMKRPKYRLMISPNTAAPLSVGLFSVRVVLPRRDYAPEELSLLFRHELAHILRSDNWTKLFMATCAAMCWFNPLMWLAMRRCAEDLELSCDEVVLCRADAAERKRYAALLLNTAGDARGFTTCLSASAAALRYRLKNIVRPRERLVGGVTVGLVFFLLLTTCGYAAVAWDSRSGAEALFSGGAPEEYTSLSFHDAKHRHGTYYDYPDPQALTDYLSGLTLCRLTGSYDFPEDATHLSIVYKSDGTVWALNLSDRLVRMFPLYERYVEELWYLPDGVDWDHVESLLIPAV